jgi:hypothetical protein
MGEEFPQLYMASKGYIDEGVAACENYLSNVVDAVPTPFAP